jgi:HEAT repeat protein
MVIGWLHPVILLPASALTGLTPQQLEAIIAHELAHIRRHDYLINLLQALIEALLFYHPAVWWVSRQIRQEREHCCDDLAVTVCGDARAYARALLEMEQLRAAGPHLAMAANGGSLLPRIQRLVGAEPKRANRFGGLSAGVIALTTVVSAAAGAQILLQAADSADRQVVLAPEDRAAEALLPALQSTSWEVRKAAVERLAQLGGTRGAVEALLGALNDRDWQVREQAAIALGRVHDERAVEPLLKALVDSEWAVREQAARSLGTAGQERAVEPLIHALGDEHQQVREAAAKSLGIIGDRRAMEPLFQALQDADEQVRTKAVEALGLLGEYHPPTVQRGGGVHRVRGPRRSAAMTSRHP